MDDIFGDPSPLLVGVDNFLGTTVGSPRGDLLLLWDLHFSQEPPKRANAFVNRYPIPCFSGFTGLKPGEKRPQNKCAVYGEVGVSLRASRVFKAREAFMLEDATLLSFQGASDP